MPGTSTLQSGKITIPISPPLLNIFWGEHTKTRWVPKSVEGIQRGKWKPPKYEGIAAGPTHLALCHTSAL